MIILKKVKICSMALILSIMLYSCMSSVKNGFLKENDSMYYYLNGKKQVGWIKDNNDYYFFNADGIMQTGWLKENEFWYYLDDNGKMYKDKLLVDKGKTYYFNNDGQMVTSVKKMIDGWEYTFDSNGEGTKIDGNMYLGNVRMTNIMGVPVEKSSLMVLGDHNGENFVIDITYSTVYQSATCNINVGTFDTITF